MLFVAPVAFDDGSHRVPAHPLPANRDPAQGGGRELRRRGTALTTLLASPRVSRDIDLFHDTDEALQATWEADRRLLENSSFHVDVARERPTFVEARVRRDDETVLVQWVRDSAFRFFPLVEHDELGLTLHPYDLATNKVLALVGRLEVRDWVDLIECHRKIQRLGYLTWGACGKDPGFSPRAILEQARRSSRYTDTEIAELDFDGPPPQASALSVEWHGMLEEADAIVSSLPPDEVGTCVVTPDGRLFNDLPADISQALSEKKIRFHAGRIRGALPRIVESK